MKGKQMKGKDIIEEAVSVLKSKNVRLTDSAILQQIERMTFSPNTQC